MITIFDDLPRLVINIENHYNMYKLKKQIWLRFYRYLMKWWGGHMLMPESLTKIPNKNHRTRKSLISNLIKIR